MNHTHESVREQLSALADGNLPVEDFHRVVGAVAADAALQSTWRTYHVIGDVLRSGEHAPCSDSSAFMARFQQRMAAEPALAAPSPVEHGTYASSIPSKAVLARTVKVAPVEAANEPVFRWKLVAGAASLAAAAAIGWNLVGFGVAPAGMQMAQQQSTQGSTVATAASAVPSTQIASQDTGSTAANGRFESAPVLVGNGEPQVMLRDARLDVLLEAHRQTGGASQMPSGFLRNATFDGPSR